MITFRQMIADNGGDPTYAMRMMFGCEEFTNRNLSNEDYITVLYRSIFFRDPDPDGFDIYLGQLNGGATREEVLDIFLGSEEWNGVIERSGLR